MLSVIIRHCPEGFLWLPRHVWVSFAVFAVIIVFYEAGARHVKVKSRVLTVRGDLGNKLENECAFNSCIVQNPRFSLSLCACHSSSRTDALSYGVEPVCRTGEPDAGTVT